MSGQLGTGAADVRLRRRVLAVAAAVSNAAQT